MNIPEKIPPAYVSDTDLKELESYMNMRLNRGESPCIVTEGAVVGGLLGGLLSAEIYKEVDTIAKRKTFSDRLFELIAEKNLDDTALFYSIGKDNKYLSKVRCHKDYRPSLDVACALAIQMHLTTMEAEELLGLAGYSLKQPTKFNIIIEFAIKKNKFNIEEVETVLEKYDMSFKL